MTRLYLATNNGDISGGEVMLFAIARAAREEGWEVSVIAPRTPDEVCRRADAEGYDVVRLAADSRLAYMAQLARWAARHRDAWIWCNGLVPSFALIGHRRRITHLHQVPTGANRIFAAALRAAGRISFAPSHWAAAHVPGTRALPNWTPALPAVSSRELSEGDAVHLGFIGRLSTLKGVGTLARSIALLQEDGLDIRLHLAGDWGHIDPAQRETVQKALAVLPEHDLIRHGRIPPEQLHREVDLLVLPSQCGEVFGLTAAEAMSAGVPLVVSDDGALPELLGPEHPWIARAGDAQNLAAVLRSALRTLREDPERARRIIDAAHTRWRRLYSPEAGRARVAEVLGCIRRGEDPIPPAQEGRP